MNKLCQKLSFIVATAGLLFISGCQFDGGPVFKDGEPAIKIGQPVNDSALLTIKVREALRNSPQTAILRINVSSPSDDTIRLTGYVDDDATRFEAERVAGTVEGVRFVDNALNIRNY